MYNIGPKTFQLGTGGGIRCRLAKLATGKAVLNTSDPADRPVGAIVGMDGDGDAGDFAALHFLKDNGTIELETAGAISVDADVFDADAGKIQALPIDPDDVAVWSPGETVALGDLRVPTEANGYVYICSDAGDTDDPGEPTWPTDDSEVTDGTAKWKKHVRDTFKLRGVALQAASADGSIIEVLPTDMVETVTVAAPAPALIADPGDTNAIDVSADGVCAITTEGAETRSIPAPDADNRMITLVLDVDGGDLTVTSAVAINVTGNNTMVLNNAGEAITLVGVRVAGALVWRVLANDGVTLSTV